MNDIYTPKHGKWSQDDLFTAAKIFDDCAKKIALPVSDLLVNMSNGGLFNALENLLMLETKTPTEKVTASLDRICRTE